MKVYTTEKTITPNKESKIFQEYLLAKQAGKLKIHNIFKEDGREFINEDFTCFEGQDKAYAIIEARHKTKILCECNNASCITLKVAPIKEIEIKQANITKEEKENILHNTNLYMLDALIIGNYLYATKHGSITIWENNRGTQIYRPRLRTKIDQSTLEMLSKEKLDDCYELQYKIHTLDWYSSGECY